MKFVCNHYQVFVKCEDLLCFPVLSGQILIQSFDSVILISEFVIGQDSILT